MNTNIPLPLQLIAIIIGVFSLGHLVPEPIVRSCFTFSLVFKEVLSMVLPLIVFAFVFAGITSFKKNAPAVLAITLIAITASNTLVALLSYGVTLISLPFITSGIQLSPAADAIQLEPYFNFVSPFVIGAEKALLAALALGILVNFISLPELERTLLKLKGIVHTLLSKLLIPFLPLYVLGFLLKINHEGTFLLLFQQYGKAFIVIITMQIAYLTFLYMASQGFSIRDGWQAIKNAFPSYITGFSTMSSAVTIPITLEGAEKNLGGPSPLAELSIPIMANVHLLGDCISTPILALTTLSLYTGTLPDFGTYFVFMAWFALSMLAASGVPGGAIIVMLPLLESIFGFGPEMINIIMTLYLVQDPLGTAGNVMGDGALVIIINKVLRRLRIIHE